MKAQFKYAFLAGLFFRGPVFIVIFILNTVFIILGSAGLLPFAAHVTAVSLGGIALAVMLTACIIGDIAIGRRMFLMPEAYLHALTPVPRRKTLFASIITMAVMDLISIAFVVFTQVWLSLNLAGISIWNLIREASGGNPDMVTYIIMLCLLMVSFYILTLNVIMFSVTVKKSFFFKIPASGLLAFLSACGCFYAAGLLQLLIAPFSEVSRYLFMIIITPVSAIAIPLLIALTLLEAAGLFILTSKLMERKINL